MTSPAPVAKLAGRVTIRPTTSFLAIVHGIARHTRIEPAGVRVAHALDEEADDVGDLDRARRARAALTRS